MPQQQIKLGGIEGRMRRILNDMIGELYSADAAITDTLIYGLTDEVPSEWREGDPILTGIDQQLQILIKGYWWKLEGEWWHVTDEGATTVSAANTLYELTSAIGGVGHRPLFGSGDVFNEDFRWTETTLGADPFRSYDYTAQLLIKGTAGDEYKVHVRRWDDSQSLYKLICEIPGKINNVVGPNDFGISMIVCPFQTGDTVGDRIELWIENLTAARNFTVMNGSTGRIRAV